MSTTTSSERSVEPSSEHREGRATLSPAKPSTGSGPVPVVGLVLALLTLGLGVVLVRDALVFSGAVGGKAWSQSLVQTLRGTTPALWMLFAGIVIALIGLWLVLVAFGRRRRSTVPVRAQTGIVTRTRDVARLSSQVARDVDGVLDARTSASRRSVTVSLTTTGDDSVPPAVQSAVERRLGVLDPTPRVTVRTTRTDDDDRSTS